MSRKQQMILSDWDVFQYCGHGKIRNSVTVYQFVSTKTLTLLTPGLPDNLLLNTN